MNSELPLIVKIAESPLCLFIFFLLATIFFHVYYIRWKPLTEVQWKQADYFWLSIAALGLFGLSGQVRQSWFQMEVRSAEIKVSGSLQRLKADVSDADGPAVCRAPNQPTHPLPKRASIAVKYDAACKEFKRLSIEISSATESREVGFGIDGYSALGSTGDPTLNNIYESMVANDKAYVEGIIERRKARELTQSNNAETTFRILSPFLLVIAIALRFAKVSGEVRLKRQSEAARKSDMHWGSL